MIKINTTNDGVEIIIEKNPYTPNNGTIIAPLNTLVLSIDGSMIKINTIDGLNSVIGNVNDVLINGYKCTKNNIIDSFINVCYKNTDNVTYSKDLINQIEFIDITSDENGLITYNVPNNAIVVSILYRQNINSQWVNAMTIGNNNYSATIKTNGNIETIPNRQCRVFYFIPQK